MLGTVIAYSRKTKRARSSAQEPIIDDFTLRNTVSVKDATELTGTLEVETQVLEKEETPSADFNSVVKKGELLAELDKLTLSQSVSQAKANVTSAESQLKYAKLTYDRTKQLYLSDTVTLASFFLLPHHRFTTFILGLRDVRLTAFQNFGRPRFLQSAKGIKRLSLLCVAFFVILNRVLFGKVSQGSSFLPMGTLSSKPIKGSCYE